MAQVLLDLFYSFGNCLNCFPGNPNLKINNRSFKILRLLGEGGFSYVYLVEDTSTHELFALKKIRCPFGAESVQQAMREVDAYRLFSHVPTIISAVDHSVATERGADEATKTVYVLLPYYKRGNLQDMINAKPPANHHGGPPSQPYTNGLPPSPRRLNGPAPPPRYTHPYQTHGHNAPPPPPPASHLPPPTLTNGAPPPPPRHDGFSHELHQQRPTYPAPHGSPPGPRNGPQPPSSRPASGASASPSLRNLLS
ncbi:hypothetical protein FOC4_g10010307 [Fusarium odoratissimum]|uniref:non-specific serine/threonine protein kinase n=1 Tax=Fusarium oxysporum f. sp. cubense (strain race 4) TaxID=2502994 RepID=N1RNJ9_FUSC4|nr:hypothetical protein FOC4_g10010307 [Fusarium odoratissimum]